MYSQLSQHNKQTLCQHYVCVIYYNLAFQTSVVTLFACEDKYLHGKFIHLGRHTITVTDYCREKHKTLYCDSLLFVDGC